MHGMKSHKSKNHIFVRFFPGEKTKREKKIDNKIKSAQKPTLLLKIIPIIVNGWRYCYMHIDEMRMEDKHWQKKLYTYWNWTIHVM